MSWVVDSCCLLDIALNDSKHGLDSAHALESIRDYGLVVCPISEIEISPFFDGSIQHVRKFLDLIGVAHSLAWESEDTITASEHWTNYVLKKRKAQVGKRPVADILIGSFASRFEGLVTRNKSDFAAIFPKLRLR